jgi:acyl-CoA ligase (AMP-forming) (exosortase A-associated)
MINLVTDLVLSTAKHKPTSTALKYQDDSWSYAALANAVLALAAGLKLYGLPCNGRVAIYADKRPETVISIWAASAAGGVFVPVNPLLKAQQLSYILRDCDVHTLVTTRQRWELVASELKTCMALRQVILMDEKNLPAVTMGPVVHNWESACKNTSEELVCDRIDQDMAAILYTSGSTGGPKGVVLSHRNIVEGARSVAKYLEISADDRLLTALPLSFDYGLNQLTSAFMVGATIVLHNHLFARDIIAIVQRERITGLAAVPPLWMQLSELPWSTEITHHVRYITNSGGHMPLVTLQRLRAALPATRPFLMYGLTEAFRSTYLPPEELDRRPDSIGKAIPNAEIIVAREDGSLCGPNEPGELVHRGVHVSLGYWNDPERTALRFRPTPSREPELTCPELAVWSGDMVRRDEDGFIYFIGRRDEMIKTSGYRVSPLEVEEVVSAVPGVAETVAFGIPHPRLGQAIVVVAVLGKDKNSIVDTKILLAACQQALPSYMQPSHLEILDTELPRNANGKLDRKKLTEERIGIFANNLELQ